jgi:hypothetical protein
MRAASEVRQKSRLDLIVAGQLQIALAGGLAPDRKRRGETAAGYQVHHAQAMFQTQAIAAIVWRNHAREAADFAQ